MLQGAVALKVLKEPIRGMERVGVQQAWGGDVTLGRGETL